MSVEKWFAELYLPLSGIGLSKSGSISSSWGKSYFELVLPTEVEPPRGCSRFEPENLV